MYIVTYWKRDLLGSQWNNGHNGVGWYKIIYSQCNEWLHTGEGE